MSRPAGYHHSAETRARIRAKVIEINADPEWRRRHCERIKAALADPQVKERHRAGIKAALADPEFLAKRAERIKAAWTDPETKARHSEAMRLALAKKAAADPATKARTAEKIRAFWTSEKRAEASVRAKARWSVPGAREAARQHRQLAAVIWKMKSAYARDLAAVIAVVTPDKIDDLGRSLERAKIRDIVSSDDAMRLASLLEGRQAQILAGNPLECERQFGKQTT